MSNGCGNLLKKEAGMQVSMEKTLNRQSERFGLRKRNDFPSRNGGKGKVKDTCIDSRRALDFGSGMTFPAATVEKERLKTHALVVGSPSTLDA